MNIKLLSVPAAALVSAAIGLPTLRQAQSPWTLWSDPGMAFGWLCAIVAALLGLSKRTGVLRTVAITALTLVAATVPVRASQWVASGEGASFVPAAGFWMCFAAIAFLLVDCMRRIARHERQNVAAMACTTLFGLLILFSWHVVTQALAIPQVLLPGPTSIASALTLHVAVLREDFVQTVLQSALIGYAIGCGSGFLAGVVIERSTFLQRGILPWSALVSTMPLVGVAPIMVMWFGFDWPSKAAVVAIMTFFPMLVNTTAGLRATGHMELDLMKSYGTGYWRTLLMLRMPMAMPFVFGALKINSTLALIGAIVAEFFGSPTVGLGFRISTEAARLNMPLVWAAIVVASVAGALFFALISATERRITFWHPSVRQT